MTLIDAGPLVALANKGDQFHAHCVSLLDRVTLPLWTTWPVITESTYLLAARGGPTATRPVERLISRGDLRLIEQTQADLARAFELMDRYRDVPMDLADATLVAGAESTGDTTVFTLDSDFRVYRVRKGTTWRSFSLVG